MALKGSDSIGIMAWVRDLNYDEVHSFTMGFGVAAMAAFLDSTTVSLALFMLMGLGYLGAYGVRKFGNKRLRYILREPHYYVGGTCIGLLAGLLLGVPF